MRSDSLRSRLRGLYAVTPDEPDTAALARKVDAALAGGARAIQYRNKAADAALRAAQAREIVRIARGRHALCIVNDDAALAREVLADGVHIGEDDADLASARATLGARAIIGVSCYDDVERARRLVAQGADYIAFGSFFSSRVKPGARRADVSLIAAAKGLGVPVVAIGGITAANAPSLVAAGVDAVAVISDVFGHAEADAVARAAAAIADCFERIHDGT
ncbi:MAG: thiamine phosphate synthase [Burkholderiales bacterium]|nr:thiamine phosphate synthase [Burkholderiales bacterium]